MNSQSSTRNLSQGAKDTFKSASEAYKHKKRIQGLIGVFIALALTYGVCAWYIFMVIINAMGGVN